MNDDGESSNRSLMDRIVNAIGGEPRDQEELLVEMREARKRGILDQDTLQMIEGVFNVVDMQVRDIMIPRAQMVVVEKDAEMDELLPVIIESGHSRFPVIGEDKDDVVGILLAKDVLRFSSKQSRQPFEIDRITRPFVSQPESKRLNVLLKEFRSNRNHMAIVFDEYGGVAGLVTIEDVLEQIVGKIDDEHDADEGQNIRDHGEGRFSVRALTPIEEFNNTLTAEFSDDEFDTIGGVVMANLGHMPKPGESIDINGFQFKILAADNRRIHLIQVTRVDAENQQTA